MLRSLSDISADEKELLNTMLTSAFTIKYESASSYSTEMARFEVVSFADFKDLELKLVFNDPLNVSFGADSSASMDKITIEMTNPDVFYDPELGQAITKAPLEPKPMDVPPQIPDGLQSATEGVLAGA